MGVFCYWIPGTWLNVLQSILMKNKQFLKLIGMKLPPSMR